MAAAQGTFHPEAILKQVARWWELTTHKEYLGSSESRRPFMWILWLLYFWLDMLFDAWYKTLLILSLHFLTPIIIFMITRHMSPSSLVVDYSVVVILALYYFFETAPLKISLEEMLFEASTEYIPSLLICLMGGTHSSAVVVYSCLNATGALYRGNGAMVVAVLSTIGLIATCAAMIVEYHIASAYMITMSTVGSKNTPTGVNRPGYEELDSLSNQASPDVADIEAPAVVGQAQTQPSASKQGSIFFRQFEPSNPSEKLL